MGGLVVLVHGGEKNFVAEDDRGGGTGPGHGCGPKHAGFLGKLAGQALFGGGSVEKRAAPLRPVLGEELGVAVDAAARGPPLGPPRRAELRQGPVWDREVVSTFWLRGWEGGVEADGSEVAATRWAERAALKAELAATPEAFTPWLLDELALRPELVAEEAGGG